MYPKSGQIKGIYNPTKNSKIDLKLAFIEFEEDDCKIVYCPALDVSGYGKTEQEADQSFKIALGSFFTYSINKGTFINELRRLGWQVKKLSKPMIPPNMSKLLSENENFSRIFNNHSFTKYDKEVEIPLV